MRFFAEGSFCEECAGDSAALLPLSEAGESFCCCEESSISDRSSRAVAGCVWGGREERLLLWAPSCVCLLTNCLKKFVRRHSLVPDFFYGSKAVCIQCSTFLASL